MGDQEELGDVLSVRMLLDYSHHNNCVCKRLFRNVYCVLNGIFKLKFRPPSRMITSETFTALLQKMYHNCIILLYFIILLN